MGNKTKLAKGIILTLSAKALQSQEDWVTVHLPTVSIGYIPPGSKEIMSMPIIFFREQEQNKELLLFSDVITTS